MFEVRAFGEQPATVRTGAVSLPAASGGGFWHIYALTDVAVNTLVMRYPSTEVLPDSALTIPAGQQLPGVKSCNITTGTYFAMRIY